MRERPKTLLWVSALLVTVSIGIPIQIMFLFGHWPWEATAIAAKMAPLNWVVCAIAPIAAIAVFRASPHTKWIVPTLSAVVVYNNWLVAQFQGATWMVAAASSGVFLAAMSALAFGGAGTVIANPSRRWWLVRRRFKHRVPIRVRFAERESDTRERELRTSLELVGQGFAPLHDRRSADNSPRGEFTLSTFDLSETGAFVALRGSARALERLRVGTRCRIQLPLGLGGTLDCHAQVVRRVSASGQYPAGVGFKFQDLTWTDQRRLGAYLARLEAKKRSHVRVSSAWEQSHG